MPPTTSSSSDHSPSAALREDLVRTMRGLEADGLNRAAAGNASARCGAHFLITPTGVLPAELQPGAMVEMTLDGTPLTAHFRPSSEWRFHAGIYAARPDAGAVVHVHSPYATALACTRREIPPFHYMVAVAGGATIPCAAYATFGTESLAQAVVAALAGRSACLLANHGLVAIGPSLPRARRLAVEVEELARQYLLALGAGGPVLLNDAEIADAIRQFKGYGQQDT
jgi:L-fuculose-phosphate aldolase